MDRLDVVVVNQSENVWSRLCMLTANGRDHGPVELRKGRREEYSPNFFFVGSVLFLS